MKTENFPVLIYDDNIWQLISLSGFKNIILHVYMYTSSFAIRDSSRERLVDRLLIAYKYKIEMGRWSNVKSQRQLQFFSFPSTFYELGREFWTLSRLPRVLFLFPPARGPRLYLYISENRFLFAHLELLRRRSHHVCIIVRTRDHRAVSSWCKNISFVLYCYQCKFAIYKYKLYKSILIL